MTLFSHNIRKIKDGFILDVVGLAFGVRSFTIPQQDFISQKIDIGAIKCVKTYNKGNQDLLSISSDVDAIVYHPLSGGVQPLTCHKTLRISAFWGYPYNHKIVFYYNDIANYAMSIPLIDYLSVTDMP